MPKGVNGADLLQRVRSPSGQLCGTIVWEAKQTKAWQPAWLRKLKDDQQAVGAELAVLVTSAMPRDVREPFLREADVWVARFDAARAASPKRCAARSSSCTSSAQANAGPQREDGAGLQLHLQPAVRTACASHVVDGFAAMRSELEAEKSAMTRIWKKREAQLTRMTDGLLGVVGDLQGIGQEAVGQLESIAVLPDGLADEMPGQEIGT